MTQSLPQASSPVSEDSRGPNLRKPTPLGGHDAHGQQLLAGRAAVPEHNERPDQPAEAQRDEEQDEVKRGGPQPPTRAGQAGGEHVGAPTQVAGEPATLRHIGREAAIRRGGRFRRGWGRRVRKGRIGAGPGLLPSLIVPLASPPLRQVFQWLGSVPDIYRKAATFDRTVVPRQGR
jgi:hypothetical protein